MSDSSISIGGWTQIEDQGTESSSRHQATVTFANRTYTLIVSECDVDTRERIRKAFKNEAFVKELNSQIKVNKLISFKIDFNSMIIPKGLRAEVKAVLIRSLPQPIPKISDTNELQDQAKQKPRDLEQKEAPSASGTSLLPSHKSTKGRKINPSTVPVAEPAKTSLHGIDRLKTVPIRKQTEKSTKPSMYGPGSLPPLQKPGKKISETSLQPKSPDMPQKEMTRPQTSTSDAQAPSATAQTTTFSAQQEEAIQALLSGKERENEQAEHKEAKTSGTAKEKPEAKPIQSMEDAIAERMRRQRASLVSAAGSQAGSDEGSRPGSVAERPEMPATGAAAAPPASARGETPASATLIAEGRAIHKERFKQVSEALKGIRKAPEEGSEQSAAPKPVTESVKPDIKEEYKAPQPNDITRLFAKAFKMVVPNKGASKESDTESDEGSAGSSDQEKK